MKLKSLVCSVWLTVVSIAVFSVPVYAVVVQQNLDAKITNADGIFVGLVGETLLVRIFYDTDLIERTPGTPDGDSFSSFDPISNSSLTMGVEIEVAGIVRSTVAPGVAHHDINISDVVQLDQWDISTTNVLTPINHASITLRGDNNYVLPGDKGLTGVPIFPPDYCAAKLFATPLALGNFESFSGGQLEGALIYDFLQGPTCSPPAVVCGDANGDGSTTATDALMILGVAIGIGSCELCVCDINDSGATTAADALAVLNAAVGQPVVLTCRAC
jgi:hypothetical protein